MPKPETTANGDMFTLSYVNMRESTTYLDTLFTSFDEVTDWVADTFPEYVSYQVLVSRGKS